MRPSFLTKVMSDFHLNEDIILLSLCPHPSRSKVVALHSLDMIRAVRVYLSAASFGRLDSLFVIADIP